MQLCNWSCSSNQISAHQNAQQCIGFFFFFCMILIKMDTEIQHVTVDPGLTIFTGSIVIRIFL